MVYFSTVMFKMLTFALGFLSLARQAHAYLDPGTGSYVVQILIATLAGGAYLIVSSWTKVKGFLSSLISRLSGRKKKDGDRSR